VVFTHAVVESILVTMPCSVAILNPQENL